MCRTSISRFYYLILKNGIQYKGVCARPCVVQDECIRHIITLTLNPAIFLWQYKYASTSSTASNIFMLPLHRDEEIMDGMMKKEVFNTVT